MGVLKFYLLILLTFNHSRNVASFDIDSLLTRGINFVQDSWTKIENFVSHTCNTVKDYVKDSLLYDITTSRSQRFMIPKPNRFRKPDSTRSRFKATKIYLPLGYRLESHMVLTQDGYILKLHRLLTTGDHISCSMNKTALFHHGLLGSSADWLLLGENHSLPLLLSNEGYDVWLANARGNDYSNARLNINNNIKKYWDFSFQEMGQYDLPAVINYMIKVIKDEMKIDFIGYSMGTSAFLVMTSTMPKYQEYFRTAVLLAPLAYMSNAEGPLKMLAALSTEDLEKHSVGEFFSKKTIPKWMVRKYCVGSIDLCSNPLFFLTGVPCLDAISEAKVKAYVPAGGSTKTIAHYAKLIKNGLFTSYMGSEFPIGKITVPTFFISAQGDMVSKVEEVSKLYKNLARPIHHHVIDENFTHADFMWSNQAKPLVYDKVIEFLNGKETFNAIEDNEIVSSKVY